MSRFPTYVDKKYIEMYDSLRADKGLDRLTSLCFCLDEMQAEGVFRQDVCPTIEGGMVMLDDGIRVDAIETDGVSTFLIMTYI